MIRILMRKCFLVWDRDLVIDVADFCSNVPGLYFNGFGIHRCPIVENSGIVGLLEQVLQFEAGFSFMILISSAILCIS